MKKLLFYSLITAVVLPSYAYAAYNDVTLTSSASLGFEAGLTLDVVGDSNVIETITVNGGSFTFTLDTNSVLEVSSPANKQIQHDAAAAYVANSLCESNSSKVKFSSTADDITISVTPKNATCPGGGSTGGSSGGGGGGATVVSTPLISANTREAQIAALLKAIVALQEQMKALIGVSVPAVPSSVCPYNWTRSLRIGSVGKDVKKLQQFLNTDLSTRVASSGPGSSGAETSRFGPVTRAAVKKFQEKYAPEVLSPSKLTSGTGGVGPSTRAKLNALCK